MCEQLGQVREALGRYAAGFDPSLLSGDDAAVVAEAAVIENLQRSGTSSTPAIPSWPRW